MKDKLNFDMNSESNNSKKNTQLSSIIFKTNDDLLNGMSNRTIDEDMFDVSFRKKKLIKKDSIKEFDKKKVENINCHLLETFSGNVEIENYNNYRRKSEVELELYLKILFDPIFNNENSFHKINKNKKIFTNCLLKEQTLLCKINKSHVKMKYGKKITLYHLYTDFTNKFLLSCKKISNLTNTEYIFCTSDNPLDYSNESIIGKVISKFFGNEYNIFDVSDNNKASKLIGTIDYVSFFVLFFLFC